MTVILTEQKKTIVYKIQRDADGLYSNGGSTPGFTKVGKIWRQKGHLTSHLGQLRNRTGNYLSWNRNSGPQSLGHVYDDCTILTFELVEIPAGPGVTVGEYLQEIKERKQKKEQASQEYQRKVQKATRLEQYQKLQKEFG